MRDALMWLATAALVVMAASAAGDAAEALARGDLAAAEVAAQAQVDAAPDDPVALQRLGRVRLAMGDAAGAIEILERAAARAPGDPEVQVLLGKAHGTRAANTHLFAAGRHGRAARAALDEALRLAPGHTGALEAQIDYARNAPRLFGGDRARALALSQRLAQIDPHAGRLQQARSLLALGRTDEARALLAADRDAGPIDPRVALELGYLAQGEKDWARALAWFSRGVAHAPGAADLERARVLCRYQIGRTAVFGERDVERGIDAMRAYIEHAPQWHDAPGLDWARFRLGQLYELAGRTGAARAAYGEALAASDDRELRRRVERRLRRLDG